MTFAMTSFTAEPGREPIDANLAIRLKLAGRPDTPAAVLAVLARDPAASVRIGVAVNGSAPAHADALLADDGDEAVRAVLARKLASCLPKLDGRTREAMHARTLATLRLLAADEAVRVRAAIADAVKDLPAAPRDVILQLAADHDLSVFDPVIRLSPLLTTEDLLNLLANPGSAETATAIARRPVLQEQVCDVIAEGFDEGAIAALLENSSASIRETTLDRLVARAATHAEWHEPLISRPKLSPRAASALSLIVSTRFVKALAGRTDLPAETIRLVRHRLEERLASVRHPEQVPLEELPQDQAVAEARVLREEGGLVEAVVIAAMLDGRECAATAMLAVAADVSYAVVAHTVSMRSAKALVSIVWKGGFSMQAALTGQTALMKLSPAAIIRPKQGGLYPLNAAEMHWQVEALMRQIW